MKNDSLPYIIKDCLGITGIKNKFFKDEKSLAKFLYKEYDDLFSKDFSTQNPHDKAYFLSISKSKLNEALLIPTMYFLRDLDAYISSTYRNVNEISRSTIGSSSLSSIFHDSFERKPISADFDEGIGKVLNQYISGEKK